MTNAMFDERVREVIAHLHAEEAAATPFEKATLQRDIQRLMIAATRHAFEEQFPGWTIDANGERSPL